MVHAIVRGIGHQQKQKKRENIDKRRRRSILASRRCIQMMIRKKDRGFAMPDIDFLATTASTILTARLSFFFSSAIIRVSMTRV
jgi:hypothetical protein